MVYCHAKMNKILFLTDTTHYSDRDLQRGFFDYLDETGIDWDLRIVQGRDASLASVAIRQVEDGEIDGIILSEELAPDDMDLLANTPTPLVVVGLRHARLEARRTAIAFVRNDNRRIGALAAEHLVSLGRFNSYVYVPAPGAQRRYWSDARRDGFRDALKRRGLDVACLPADADLVGWLSERPRPTGVFAAYDERAADVLHACVDAGLNIPNALSILGVDNDDIICCQCRPKLSSVHPGHRGMGYAAARELHRLLTDSACRAAPRIVTIPPREVVARDSTRALPPAARLVRSIRDFIRQNACRRITVADIVRHVRVSRRLAELRFREIEGESLRTAIETQKLAEARKMLSEGRRTVAAAARRCGFASANRLSRAFKRRYGLSIRDWLAQSA